MALRYRATKLRPATATTPMYTHPRRVRNRAAGPCRYITSAAAVRTIRADSSQNAIATTRATVTMTRRHPFRPVNQSRVACRATSTSTCEGRLLTALDSEAVEGSARTEKP